MRAHAGRGLLAAGTAVAVAAALAGCGTRPVGVPVSPPAAPASTPLSSPAITTSGSVPRFAHVVIVVEENKALHQVTDAPFLHRLARDGATFSDLRAKTHPSQPNYIDLWSGSTHGVTSDACPVDLGATPSLGSQLLASGHSVTAYAEGLPTAGSQVCAAGDYARKHDPLADFTTTRDAAHDKPFTDFPSSYSRLPAVSFVVPDLQHDMHDGSVAEGDRWLEQHLADYARWAPSHDSLLVVTFDEDDRTAGNRVYTTLSGAHVRPGTYSEPVTHVRLLHTIESSFGLPHLGAPAAPLTDVWR